MYHFSKLLNTSFDEAIAQVIESLQDEGFGVLTEIDAQMAFRQKLGENYRPYKILGACFPKLAYDMLQIDDKAGVLFPCNVILQAHDDGRVEVSAIDPTVMFAPINHPKAEALATEASQMLQAVIDRLNAPAYELLTS